MIRSTRAAAGRPPVARLIAFNKPFGMLCQFTGEGRPTLADAVPIAQVYPAGRLDADSEGLLLLTDSGALQARISAPKGGIIKTYLVQVEGEAGADALARLGAGVLLKDGPARARAVRRVGPPEWLWPRTPPVRHRLQVPTSWLEIDLDEGRNRQVRRMTAAVALPTLRLVRIAVGPIRLGDLAPGAWRDEDPAVFRNAVPPRPARSR